MQPTPAEQARTAVARARVGLLTTYGRRAPLVRTTHVGVAGDGAALVVRLRPESPAVTDLLARPLAAVRVGPPGFVQVLLQGSVVRLPGRDDRGRLRFRVDPGAVRVDDGGPVAVADYRSADPDPLRDDAPVLLAHLRAAHRADLGACLRARGHHDVEWVEPQALDRHGLQLAALTADGVARHRLDFPRPVGSLDELSPGLTSLLRCRCTA